MHHQLQLQPLTLKFQASSSHHVHFSHNFSFPIPNSLTLPVFTHSPPVGSSVSLRCRKSTAAAADVFPIGFAPTSSGDGIEVDRDFECAGGVSVAEKRFDVATLGNLCVDIILGVPELPPPSPHDRKAFMDKLAASPPDKKYWEAGGNCNMAIAAARLGLHCAAIGHVGDEIYGKFLLDVLREEGISVVGMNDETQANITNSCYETLLCWVLVDPLHRHGFCSRADFIQEPAFNWITQLSDEVKMAIRQSKVLFCNGYDFDEFYPSYIISTIEYASKVGTAIFFDPGPRGKSLANGTPEERKAFDRFLRMSDVLLLTSEEAEALTGIKNPIRAGQQILRNGTNTKWVIVKMGSKGSILISSSSVSLAPAFKVAVIDTVGCGDSFVAAIAFGFIHKLPLVNTIMLANAVGAATAMGCGAGRNVATRQLVIELMKASNLDEDDEFYKDLLGEISELVTVLSKGMINGHNNRMEKASIEKVVSTLLPELEFARRNLKVSS